MAVATPAAHAAATTLVLDAQENYYLPTKGEGPNLDLGITASGGDALDVSVAVDASSLAGKATMVVTGDCVSTGTLKVRCDKGVMLLVQDSEGVSLARDRSNCHYSGRPGGGAWCRFDTPVTPGAAYETDAPLRYTASKDTMYGYNTYMVWPVGAAAPDSFDPYDFPETGTGAPLGLKPVASGSTFTGSGYGTFSTTQHADYQALGDTVEGKAGETVSITVGVRNNGPGWMNFRWMDAANSGTFVVTPPPGTTITGAPGPGEQGDPGPLWNCTPGKAGAKSYTCAIASTDFRPGDSVSQEFTVRIDGVVPGAQGSVRAVNNPEYPNRDDDTANDTTAITVKATGSATSSPTPSASAPTPATVSPSGSGTGTTSGTTTGGHLAATGSHQVLLRAGAAVLLAAGGALVLLTARRFRPRGGR
ncbi:hypothetical protein [Streptomyces sp. SAI-127]|uniref:hypothetical protein n=1 Tax=Streptomyces sp. SAI-127 TaxID=2940543 RepID=UPI0024768AE1|nr:hypothetical protein [Streptomyces sp. SAI-127]MDH6493390.1 hypothetical protein [Streptomyces sp. SAI-127]